MEAIQNLILVLIVGIPLLFAAIAMVGIVLYAIVGTVSMAAKGELTKKVPRD